PPSPIAMIASPSRTDKVRIGWPSFRFFRHWASAWVGTTPATLSSAHSIEHWSLQGLAPGPCQYDVAVAGLGTSKAVISIMVAAAATVLCLVIITPRLYILSGGLAAHWLVFFRLVVPTAS